MTGLIGIGVAAIIFAMILAIVFELARRFQLYDYRNITKKLLGPGWILFDIAFLGLLVLVLLVLAAAAGEMVANQFAVGRLVGIGIMISLVAMIVFFGNAGIERFFSGWSIVLYGAFTVFFIWAGKVLGHDIGTRWVAANSGVGAFSSGVIYAGYSLAVVPTTVYCARHFTRMREAVISGLLAGPVAMIPAALLFLIMVARYPEVNREPVPVVYMLAQLGSSKFNVIFQVVIFGTLIEAASALIHGFNERIGVMVRERGGIMPRRARSAIACGLLACSVYLAASVGIVDLVSKGYGYSTWLFLGLIAIPVFTRGLWLVTRSVEPLSGRSHA